MNNLINLPEVEFTAKDAGQTEANIIAVYEAITKRKLAPGDPVRLFLSTIASIITQQRVLIDYTGKQNLLAYAVGANLDHKGADTQTPRLPAQAAATTVRFLLSSPQPQVVTVPTGTRVTPGGNLFFATETPVDILAGSAHIDIITRCNILGIVGNDWQPGQINTLVDPLPWIQKVENITISSGGVDIEDDDSYRLRIQQAPESFSTAGPEGAYAYFAKGAHQSITDVAVDSPAPGVITIYVLAAGGAPSAEVLNAVLDKCSDKKVRPLTDYVSVMAPEQVNYEIDIEYWIDTENTTRAVAIQELVAKAVGEYTAWQQEKLGRDINPSELIARVMQAGASRVMVAVPAYVALGRSQVASVTSISVQYRGLEE